jgi:hypothetical protein
MRNPFTIRARLLLALAARTDKLSEVASVYLLDLLVAQGMLTRTTRTAPWGRSTTYQVTIQ